MNLDKLGGRKFLLTLLIIGVGTLVQLLSKNGVTESFTALLIGAAAAYGATNTIITSKAIGAAGAALPPQQQPASDDTTTTPAAPEQQPPAVNEEQAQMVLELKSSLEAHSQALSALQEGLVKTNQVVSALLLPK